MEKLRNLLTPNLPGLPVANQHNLEQCFELLQSKLDVLRAADIVKDGF